MKTWNSLDALNSACANICSAADATLTIQDEKRFRGELVDQLIWNAVFNEDEQLKNLSRWMIWEASQNLGSPAASIHDFYIARAKDQWKDCTVPAINIRTLTYDTARTIFSVLKKIDASACLLEIAKTEVSYTVQRPAEYASCILAAALRENYKGPVFIQGDHFQVNAKNFAADPEKEIAGLKKLIAEAVETGFYNIDIDASTLVDLSKDHIHEQQRANFETTAELTKYIRKVEPKGVTISVGGEIGEVGTKNSTVEELTAFMEGYNGTLALCGSECVGISKISVQSGTTHGGVVLPDGSIAKVKIDFDTLERLGTVTRKQFGVGGVVQHGASTLPDSAFDNFPKRQTVEIHLATAYQNMVYDSKAFPKELRNKIYQWLEKNCADERKADWSPEQFYYKTRKKGFGPFKQEIWSLDEKTKNALMAELAEAFEPLFRSLGLAGSRKNTEKWVKPAAVRKPRPA
ncbi:MAG: class II fructose-bisphosphate aldolase [Deltaproteobacteria bacterium]|nr:class II fructose-bisphosphate aldolase [Deltaproteobacteria bacterium]